MKLVKGMLIGGMVSAGLIMMYGETMGFNKFSSTKNQSHKDTDISGVFLGRKAKRIYQRFMNYKPFSKILKQTYMSLNQEF